MKKRKLLFTMLALILGAFLGGSGAMADNGWESVYNQTQTTSASWTKLESGSTTGKVLGGAGATSYYYIAESLNFTNSNAGGSGLTIQGTVYLYIPAGLKITCTGGNASGTTGAGAGIELAAGNTLYIIGAGDGKGGTTVTAIGGNAANGSKGGDGTDATGNSSWLQTGTGGDGGVGGGGAGAGIGTRGGAGGSGGEGGYTYTHDDKAHNGANGSEGKDGETAGPMGNLYVDNTYGIKVVATGGNAGSSGGAGGGRGKGYIWDGSYNYTVAGGGGGGGGGFGGAASNIGTGGPGGGGGGGGAGGAQDWKSSQLYDVTAYGGKGGRNADGMVNSDDFTYGTDGAEANTTRSAYENGLVVSEGGDGWDYDDWNPASGACTMGNGGAGGGKGNNASNGTQNFGTKTYNITYQPVKTRVNGTNINPVTVTYSPSTGTSVILPKNIDGYQWVLLVYGKDCSSNATIHKSAFTAENLTFYGGNSDDEAERTIVLSDVYGDIYFQEVASVCKLNNNNSNDQVITEFFYDATTQSQSYPITVRLKDRTLYKDNSWNTICLPFDLTPAQLAASPLAGAQVKKLDDEVSGYYPNGGNSDAINLHTTEPTLVFYFKNVNTSTETLLAGKPYLVKWANGTDLVDNTTKGGKTATHQLDFPNVTVTQKVSTAWEGNAANGGAVQFVGTFSPIALTGGDKTKLVLGANNKLYYPSTNMSVNACRGYFIIPNAAAASAREIVMGFDDEGETTSIQTINFNGGNQADAPVYNLNGQRLNAPKKGLNIVNGKKVIIK